MCLIKFKVAVIVVFLILITGGNSAVRGGEQDQPTTLQGLIDAARKEGQLKLMWTPTTTGGIETIKSWAKGFNKRYGLNLDINFTPGPSMGRMGARIIQEAQANRPASTDIYLSGANDVISAVQYDALESVNWTAWAPNIRNPDLVGHGGRVVAFTAPLVGIAYNSSKLTGDAVPTSLRDLLKPQYKGRIASTPYAALFDRLASPEVWGEKRAMEYVTKLGDQLGGLIGCSAYQRIVSGEFDILAIACNLGHARKWQSRGAPIGSLVPSDAPLIQHWYMAVPKTASNPNAAKLWVNYILTREAQDILYKMAFTDHPLVEGSHTARELKELEARGIKPIHVGVKFTLRNDLKKLAAFSKKVKRIFRKKK